MTKSTCNITGCTKTGRVVKGMCLMHYERVRQHGSTDAPHLATAGTRFWSKVDKTDGCWVWGSSKNQYGYGTFGVGREQSWLAHRYAWTTMRGPIGEGMSLDHICHNHACVRPEHLREVTNKQNHEHLRGAYSTSGSGVRGVSWDKARGLWKATLTHNYRQIMVGRYEDIAEAEAAIVAKRLEVFTHNNADRAA